jgi:hypothetical protein
MMKRALCIFAALAALASIGCGRPFDVKTAPGFVELDNQEPQFGYRALAPEGVVVAVRVVDINDDQSDVDFWTKAVTIRMRQLNGYALLGTKDATSLDGTKGKELTFGHDENGKPYLYRVRIFTAQSRLFVVEAGGQKDNMTKYQASVDWALASVRVQCSGFLSPVFSSRTCNRW